MLVIACPCAMGLATLAAIAVEALTAQRGMASCLKCQSLEIFKDIKQVVFDKTGTLTTGRFTIAAFDTSIDETLLNDWRPRWRNIQPPDSKGHCKRMEKQNRPALEKDRRDQRCGHESGR